MAHAGSAEELPILNGSKILVIVQHSLPDLIVVSFENGSRVFQGILLDSSKGHLPCGIYPPGGSYPPPPNLSSEKLFSVKQRHSYFCDDIDAKKGPPPRKQSASGGNGNKQKSPGRPSVRLRPRQVLCSTCRSICNEKNESVGNGKGLLGAKVTSQGALGPKALFTSNAVGLKATANKGGAVLSGTATKTGQNLGGAKVTAVSAGGAVKVSVGKLGSESSGTSNKSSQSVRGAVRETRQSSTSSGRETRLSSASPTMGVATRVKRKCVDSGTSSSILVPKLKKLKPSEIEKASSNSSSGKEKRLADSTSKSNSSTPSTACKENNQPSTVNINNTNADVVSKSDVTGSLGITNKSNKSVQISENNKVEGKIPKLKLFAVSRKVPKVTISTASLRETSPSETLATRLKNPLGCSSHDKSSSNSSISEVKEQPTIPKMVLSTLGSGGISSEIKEQPSIPKMVLSTLGSGGISSEIKEQPAIPKMVLSTSGSSGIISEIKEQPSIPKMVLSTSGILTENLDSKKAAGNGSKSAVKIGNCNKEKLKSSSSSNEGLLSNHGNNSNRENIVSPVPKVTILPFGQKRQVSETPAKSADLGKAKGRGVGGATKDAQDLEFSKPLGAPLLKICIGPDGTGTITNISPKSGPSASSSVGDAVENETEEEQLRRANASVASKAAKRALKKARKEAHRKKPMLGCSSPSYLLMGGMSPRFGGKSPLRLGGGMSPARHGLAGDRLCGASPARFGGASPGRFGGGSPGRFGGASPGRFGGTSPGRFGGGIGALSPVGAPLDLSNKDGTVNAVASGTLSKKHKHKVKHKKKHKEDRRHKQSCAVSDQTPSLGLPETDASALSTLTSLGSSEIVSNPLKLKTTLSISKDNENLVVTVSESSLSWRLQDESCAPNKSGNSDQTPKPVISMLASTTSAISSQTSSSAVPVRQKLSLSIKRLNNDSNEYVACDSNSSEAASFTTETSDKDGGFVSEGSESSFPTAVSLKSGKKLKRKLEHDPSSTSSSRLPFKKKLSLLRSSKTSESLSSTADAGESASSDEQSEVPDFPPVPDAPKPLGPLALKFRWRDIASCYIRPLYSCTLRLQQMKDIQSKQFLMAQEPDSRLETFGGAVNTTTALKASSADDSRLESVEVGPSRAAATANTVAESSEGTTEASAISKGVKTEGTSSASHLISVGDIVWGKIHGFPWWPAKITGLRVLQDGLVHGNPKQGATPVTWNPAHQEPPINDSGSSGGAAAGPRTTASGLSQLYNPRSHEAHVNWFGSSTTSMMDPAYLQPFLEFYKQRYIKKKRGPYKGAVKQAIMEAETRKLEELQLLEQEQQQQQQQQQQRSFQLNNESLCHGRKEDDSKWQEMSQSVADHSISLIRDMPSNLSDRDEQRSSKLVISFSDNSVSLRPSNSKTDPLDLQSPLPASPSAAQSTAAKASKATPPLGSASGPRLEVEVVKKPKKVILRRNNNLFCGFTQPSSSIESNMTTTSLVAPTNTLRGASGLEENPCKRSNDFALEKSTASGSKLLTTGDTKSMAGTRACSKLNIDPPVRCEYSNAGMSRSNNSNISIDNSREKGCKEQFSILSTRSSSEGSPLSRRSVSSDEDRSMTSKADTFSVSSDGGDSLPANARDTNFPLSSSSCSSLQGVVKSYAAVDTSNCDTKASSKPGQTAPGNSCATEDTGVAVSHSATYCSNRLYSAALVGSRSFSIDNERSNKEEFNIYGTKQGNSSVRDESPAASNTITVSSVFSEDNFKTYPKFKTSKVNKRIPPLLPIHVLPPGLGLSSAGMPYGFSEVAESVSNQCTAAPDLVAPTANTGAVATTSTHSRPTVESTSSTCSPSRDTCLYTLPGTSPIPDPCSSNTLGGGCSPNVENSPGEPRLGSPAPDFLESPEFSESEASPIKNKRNAPLLEVASITTKAAEFSLSETASKTIVVIPVEQKQPEHGPDVCTVSGSDYTDVKCDIVEATETEILLKTPDTESSGSSARKQNIMIRVKSRSYLLGSGCDTKDAYAKDGDVKEKAPAEQSVNFEDGVSQAVAYPSLTACTAPAKSSSSIAGPSDLSAMVEAIGAQDLRGPLRTSDSSSPTFVDRSPRDTFLPSTAAEDVEAGDCPDSSSTPPAHLATSPREVDVFS